MLLDIRDEHTWVKQKDVDFDVFLFKVARTGLLRFLSQREMVTALERVFRRASFPFWLSKGFHPRMKLVMNRALPTGVASQAEYFLIRARYDSQSPMPISIPDVLSRCNQLSPRGFRFLFARKVPDFFSLQKAVKTWLFLLLIPKDVCSREKIELSASLPGFSGMIDRGRFFVLQYRCTSALWTDYRAILKALFLSDMPPFFYLPILKEVYVDHEMNLSLQDFLSDGS